MKQILNQTSNSLSSLIEQASFYKHLLELSQNFLPTTLAKKMVGVSFKAETLIIQVTSQLVKSKLRFYEPKILQEYQHRFPHLQLSNLKINVIIFNETVNKPSEPTMKPDKASGAELYYTSEKVKHKGLKKVLQRLGQRAFDSDSSD